MGATTSRVVKLVQQENLVSDEPGKAPSIDPNLVNAWGLAFTPTGRAWVSSAERGLSQVYDAEGALALSVAIPPVPGETESNPTGQVFNRFVGTFEGDLFIFATENGTIAGWQPTDGTTAVLRVDNSKSDAIYKGVTMSQVNGVTRLFAADFHNRRIDVFDDRYQPVHMHPTTGGGAFVDPDLPANYAPFNLKAAGHLLFVTYAKQDEAGEDDVKGPGFGFVDVYDIETGSVLRLISRGALNAPWGMAMGTPEADLTVRLLVGNFGDGMINVYRLSLDQNFRLRADLEGVVGDAPDHPVVIDGLWAIEYGPGAGGANTTDLFFTAGPDDESHGLFGKLVPAMPPITGP
jgi:uncharacterized protein (TIGR03118 family)